MPDLGGGAGPAPDGSLAWPRTMTKAGATLTSQEWARLADQPVTDNVFFSPAFALPAIRYFGGAGIAVAVARADDGRLLAVAPFHHFRLGFLLPAVRLWAHDYAPLGTPLLAAAEPRAAARSLIDAVATGKTSVVVPDITLESRATAALLEAARDADRPVAVLDAHYRATVSRPRSGLRDLRSDLSRRRRKELGRQMRRLAEFGPVTIEATVEAAEIPVRFEEFLALEKSGWKGHRGTALASHAETAAMGRNLVSCLAADKGIRIDAIRVAGKPIAMLVTLIGGSTAYTWKIAYDESYARFSPGAQLMLTVGSSIFSDDRIQQIDSCAASNHPMIDHLWHERLKIGMVIIGPVGGGARFQAALLAAKAEIAGRALARRLRDRVRQHMRGNSGA